MAAVACPTVDLPSGYPMPVVGLGTFDNLKVITVETLLDNSKVTIVENGRTT